jgi:uncharacterized membrane protein YbaN (DUF454 family)
MSQVEGTRHDIEPASAAEMPARCQLVRTLYLIAGAIAFALGIVGIALPIMPTVPFMLLAAFCFARSNPAWERRLLEDPRYGPAIRAWRAKRAIARNAKIAAMAGLAGSALLGFLLLDPPWSLLPIGVATICAIWILTRPAP